MDNLRAASFAYNVGYRESVDASGLERASRSTGHIEHEAGIKAVLALFGIDPTAPAAVTPPHHAVVNPN